MGKFWGESVCVWGGGGELNNPFSDVAPAKVGLFFFFTKLSYINNEHI